MESSLYKWNELVVAGEFPFIGIWIIPTVIGAAKSGRPWNNAQHYKRWLKEAGFENVVEKHYYWPTSGWPKGKYYKQIAAYWQEDLLSGLEAISLKVMGLMGWSAEEIRVFLEDVVKDVKDTSIHAYLPM